MDEPRRVKCPECSYNVEVESPEIGDTVVCPGCDVPLRIIELEPLSVEVDMDSLEDYPRDNETKDKESGESEENYGFE